MRRRSLPRLRESRARWALALPLLLLHLATPLRLAYADEAPLSVPRREFELGLEAAQNGDLARAAEHFELAHSLSPNPVVLYNLGQVYSALGRPIDAERTLQSYLATDPAPTAARVREVRELLEYNSRRIGRLELEVTPADAEVRIDGVLLTDGSRSVRLAAGRHDIVATRSGYERRALKVEVVAESEARARLDLAPEPEPAPIPPVTARPAPPAAASSGRAPQRHEATVPTRHPSDLVRPFALGAAGLGLATLGVGAVLGLQANGLNDDSNADGHCDRSGCDDAGTRLRYAALRKGDLATAFLVAGGALVAAGATVYLLFPTRTRGPAGVSVSARSFGAGSVDVSVGMRFH